MRPTNRMRTGGTAARAREGPVRARGGALQRDLDFADDTQGPAAARGLARGDDKRRGRASSVDAQLARDSLVAPGGARRTTEDAAPRHRRGSHSEPIPDTSNGPERRRGQAREKARPRGGSRGRAQDLVRLGVRVREHAGPSPSRRASRVDPPGDVRSLGDAREQRLGTGTGPPRLRHRKRHDELCPTEGFVGSRTPC